MTHPLQTQDSRLHKHHWGVVILNWNGTEDTLACMESMDKAGANCTAVTLAGVVVDNGSHPESLERIRSAVNSSDMWDFLGLEKNLGFSRGMNAGVKHLRERGISRVLLLNNDVQVERHAISALAVMADSGAHPVIGMAVCDNTKRRPRYRAGYRYYPWLGAARSVYLSALDDRATPQVDYICGSAMLCDMAFLEDIHGVPERSFLYFEELRLAKALPKGTTLICCSGAKVRHAMGLSTISLSYPSRHYFAAHACFRYTLDYGALMLPTVALARFARLIQLSTLNRDMTPLMDGLLALWDCLRGTERRPALLTS